jgi:hypothetical protein
MSRSPAIGTFARAAALAALLVIPPSFALAAADEAAQPSPLPQRQNIAPAPAVARDQGTPRTLQTTNAADVTMRPTAARPGQLRSSNEPDWRSVEYTTGQ